MNASEFSYSNSHIIAVRDRSKVIVDRVPFENCPVHSSSECDDPDRGVGKENKNPT